MLKEALIASKLLGSGGGGGTKKMHFFLVGDPFEELTGGESYTCDVTASDSDLGLILIASEATECELVGFDTTCERQPITTSNYDISVIDAINDSLIENAIFVEAKGNGTSSLTLSAGGESITISITVINWVPQE